MKNISVLTACFFLIFNITNGETIEGIIQSSGTGEPVPYANIMIKGTDIGTISDPSGFFWLVTDTLPLFLDISHIQYKNRTVLIRRKFSRIAMEPDVLHSEEIHVVANRAVKGQTPVAFSALDRKDIQTSYSHQDVPVILNQTPGVYVYSDAGNGTGYSYLKIRGFSQDRIGIMLNGIPLNDPESHSVYWVDHGDILSAVSNIQIQRGTGNFLHGATVFGGTVNLETNYAHLPRGFQISSGYGNYWEASGLNLPGTKLSATYNGQPFKEKNLYFYSRGSYLNNPGYRVGSGTTQKSAHAGLQKHSQHKMTRLEWITGDETTHFSWDGISPQYGFDLKNRTDRRYNFYSDPDYNGGYDDANKDVFVQHLVSLQHSRKFESSLLNLTLYAVKGDGYYEQFKGDQSVYEYNLTPYLALSDTATIDLKRQKWLKNDYQGYLMQYKMQVLPSLDITLGTETRFYQSDHFGTVVSLENIEQNAPNNHKYYNSDSYKNTYSAFIHTLYSINDHLTLLTDLRFLSHFYSFDQDPMGAFNGYRYKLRYLFLNPRFGIMWEPVDNIYFFANLSTANREPADSDIYDQSDPDAEPSIRKTGSSYAEALIEDEKLINTEIGMEYTKEFFSVSLNIYRMDFRDELIPMDYRYRDDDNILKGNVPKTVHKGVEIEAAYRLNRFLSIRSNMSLSNNTFIEFTGDALGWGGYGTLADYSGKNIPGYPSLMMNLMTNLSFNQYNLNLDIKYNDKQYIDFANTEESVIPSYTVVNLSFNMPVVSGSFGRLTLDGKIFNLFDTLYETFGYNYYLDPETRIDVYWPGSTRNYFLTLTWHFLNG